MLTFQFALGPRAPRRPPLIGDVPVEVVLCRRAHQLAELQCDGRVLAHKTTWNATFRMARERMFRAELSHVLRDVATNNTLRVKPKPSSGTTQPIIRDVPALFAFFRRRGPGRFFGGRGNSSSRCRVLNASQSCCMPSSEGKRSITQRVPGGQLSGSGYRRMRSGMDQIG